jgi:hypothetical protein
MHAHIAGNRTRAVVHLVDKDGNPVESKRLISAQGFVDFVKAKWAAFVAFLVAFVGVVMPQVVTYASTAISIDTDTLFSSVNDWINVFLPIAAIGLGIAIALAVISYVGDAVLHGFSRSRR